MEHMKSNYNPVNTIFKTHYLLLLIWKIKFKVYNMMGSLPPSLAFLLTNSCFSLNYRNKKEYFFHRDIFMLSPRKFFPILIFTLLCNAWGIPSLRKSFHFTLQLDWMAHHSDSMWPCVSISQSSGWAIISILFLSCLPIGLRLPRSGKYMKKEVLLLHVKLII